MSSNTSRVHTAVLLAAATPAAASYMFLHHKHGSPMGHLGQMHY